MAFIPEGARWYIADLVLEHTIEGDPRNVVHVNIHLIEAGSPEEAHQKAMELGRESEHHFVNTEDKRVDVVFRGLRDLAVIHDALEDGVELMYEEVIGLSEDQLLDWIRPKDDLGVFARRRTDGSRPNYLPKDVMEGLEDAGCKSEDLWNETDGE